MPALNRSRCHCTSRYASCCPSDKLSRPDSKRMNAPASIQPTRLIDKFNRHVSYLRLSVTDRCDMRCVYCMTEDTQFLRRSEILSLEELFHVARAFVELGVT